MALVQRHWGKRLQEARQDAGMTQKALAAEAGITQAMLSQLENGGTFTDAMKIRLALALDIVPGRLFEWPLGILDIARYRMQTSAAETVA